MLFLFLIPFYYMRWHWLGFFCFFCIGFAVILVHDYSAVSPLPKINVDVFHFALNESQHCHLLSILAGRNHKFGWLKRQAGNRGGEALLKDVNLAQFAHIIAIIYEEITIV